jgi:hypothetical protein
LVLGQKTCLFSQRCRQVALVQRNGSTARARVGVNLSSSVAHHICPAGEQRGALFITASELLQLSIETVNALLQIS